LSSPLKLTAKYWVVPVLCSIGLRTIASPVVREGQMQSEGQGLQSYMLKIDTKIPKLLELARPLWRGQRPRQPGLTKLRHKMMNGWSCRLPTC